MKWPLPQPLGYATVVNAEGLQAWITGFSKRHLTRPRMIPHPLLQGEGAYLEFEAKAAFWGHKVHEEAFPLHKSKVG